jgi:hypothetical protein
MKIIMLDFDGCLNSKQHILAMGDFKNPGANTLSDADLFTMKRETNANNMWCLGFILDQLPDLKIVISSAWRLHYEIEQFKELFKIYKLDGLRIIGKTPRVFSNDRRHEIHMYLDDYEELHHKKPDWVAVDDHVIFNLEDPEKHREFLTDPWVGLSMHDAFKIIKHFKPEFVEPTIMI